MVATSPAMMARDAMLDRRIFMLAPLCHRTAKAIRREANTALVRGERFIATARRKLHCSKSLRRGSRRCLDTNHADSITLLQGPKAAALGAFSLFTRTGVKPDRVSVLGRAIVRIGHPGVVERIHPAHRLRDNGRAETLAEYGAGA